MAEPAVEIEVEDDEGTGDNPVWSLVLRDVMIKFPNHWEPNPKGLVDGRYKQRYELYAVLPNKPELVTPLRAMIQEISQYTNTRYAITKLSHRDWIVNTDKLENKGGPGEQDCFRIYFKNYRQPIISRYVDGAAVECTDIESDPAGHRSYCDVFGEFWVHWKKVTDDTTEIVLKLKHHEVVELRPAKTRSRKPQAKPREIKKENSTDFVF